MHTPEFLEPYYEWQRGKVIQFFIPGRVLSTQEQLILSNAEKSIGLQYHIIPNITFNGNLEGTSIQIGTDGDSFPWKLTTKIRGKTNHSCG